MKMATAAAVAALTFGAITTPALAACSTSALAGNWLLALSDGPPCSLTISTVGAVSGTCGSGRVALSTDCKLTGRVAIYTVNGRTEAIATNSPLKPNILIGSTTFNDGFIGYRR
jgi:hypothetical protein